MATVASVNICFKFVQGTIQSVSRAVAVRYVVKSAAKHAISHHPLVLERPAPITITRKLASRFRECKTGDW